MELSEKDIAKIRKTKGFCVKHNEIAADYICGKCKDVLCLICKRDHAKKMSDHKIFNYKEEGDTYKEEFIKIMEETKSEDAEAEAVKGLVTYLRNLRA